MPDYWIKWYVEIIDDPKMATLPDRLWRRFSELCLIAGKTNGLEKTGQLPDTQQLAWMLRMNPQDLQLDMVQLQRIDLIEAIPNGWVIKNFQKRQAATPGAERVRQHRERKKKQEYYEDVTEVKRKVTQRQRESTETETETETEQKANVPPPTDPFDLLKEAAESRGIILTGERDIQTVSAMVKDGVTADDLLAGIAWKASNNGGRAVCYLSQVEGPAKTAMRHRLQSGPSPDNDLERKRRALYGRPA